MTVYLQRSAWTSEPASGDTLTGTVLKGVAVHWPGTRTSRFGTESAEAVARRIRHYRDFHVDGRGWRDLGYNLVIDQAGRVWEGRTTQWRGNMVGAHCASDANPDANHEYVGVLLLLGADEEPSGAMVDAFRHWRHRHFLAGWPMRTDLREHSRVPGAQTACAGPQVRALLASGELHQSPEEDDMPSPTDWSNADREAVRDLVLSALRWPTIVPVSNGEKWNVSHVLSWLQRRSGSNSDALARVLANQQAIMAAQGVEVDETALAAQIAAVLVPAVIAALPDTGLTEAEVQDATERAVENVLRRGVDA